MVQQQQSSYFRKHWSRYFCLVTLFVLIAQHPLAHAQDSLPSWTNISGKTIEAKFISLDGNTLEIQKDGKRFKIALDSLSVASQRLAMNLARKDLQPLPFPKSFPTQWSLGLEFLGSASLGTDDLLTVRQPRFKPDVLTIQTSVIVMKKVNGQNEPHLEEREVQVLKGPLIGHTVTTVPLEKCHCFYVDGTPVGDLSSYFSNQSKTIFISPDSANTQKDAKTAADEMLKSYLDPYYRTVLRKDFAVLILPQKLGDSWVTPKFEALPASETESK